MKTLFKAGDIKKHSKIVEEADLATFNGLIIHPVCSTFALCREIEWTSRLFVLEMKDEEEEGIGTMFNIEHNGPALLGQRIDIEAKVNRLQKNELICDYIVKVEERVIACGQTGQKILKRKKIEEIFNSFK